MNVRMVLVKRVIHVLQQNRVQKDTIVPMAIAILVVPAIPIVQAVISAN